METSDSTKMIAAALCEVQTKLRPLKRNADNPFFKSNYTDLSAMTETLYPLLSSHGLSVIQGGDGNTLDTMLLHTSGEWIRTSLTMPSESNPQKLGSVVTYFRRYALAAITGAVSEGEDDDGNAASHPTQRQPAAPAPHPPAETGARPAPASPAAPAQAHGGGPALYYVKSLDRTEGQGKNGKPYVRHTVTFSDGTRASTFSESVADVLQRAKASGSGVECVFEVQGKFTNLMMAKFPSDEPGPDDETPS